MTTIINDGVDFESTTIQDQLCVIKEIGLAFESTMSFDEVLTTAVVSITKIMGAQRSTLFLIDNNGNLVSRIIEDGKPIEFRLNVGQGLAGWTARHAMPVKLNDVYNDERFDKTWDEKTGFKTYEVLTNPILGRHGTVIGVVEVLNKIEGGFGAKDLGLLDVVCAQLAMTIEHSKSVLDLVKKNQIIMKSKIDLERKKRELTFLLDLERMVARAEDLDTLANAVFARILEITESEIGVLHRIDKTGCESRIYFLNDKPSMVLRVDAGSGFAGWSATKNQELCIQSPDLDARYEESIRLRIGCALNNLGVVPLPFPAHSQVMGSILIANKSHEDGFNESDMMLLRLVASLLAGAVEHLVGRETRERDRRLATVGRLLAGVLHDLKSPMMVVSGYAELLAAQADDSDSKEYLKHINLALERMTDMTGEIIAFSKGERQMLIRSTSLADFIENFSKQIFRFLKANQIEFSIRRRTSGTVRIDEDKMLRAFHNIVNNAVEAMPQGGALVLEIDRIGSNIVFSFTDSGTGIPDEIQGSLFQSFVTLGKKEGTGLGLAVVREIVEGHSGTINFTTSNIGGTTFLLSIPL